MTIHKAKANDYASVKPEYVADYIRQYTDKIAQMIQSDKLQDKNKNQLNSIAAELETVCKRLDYILERKY